MMSINKQMETLTRIEEVSHNITERALKQAIERTKKISDNTMCGLAIQAYMETFTALFIAAAED